MARLSLSAAVAILGSGSVTVTDAEGRDLRITTSSVSGTRLSGTAPRLRVAEGGRFEARVKGEDERPWLVTFEVESAGYLSPELARVVLHARTIRLDPRHRKAERTHLGGHARLVAISCQDVVDLDVVEGSIVDLSESGVAIRTRRLLRKGDRLRFTGRFFVTEVEAEVRVMHVAEPTPGELLVGLRFVEIAPDQRATVRELTTLRPAEQRPPSFSIRRQLADTGAAGEEQRGRAGLWRMLRRSA